jgi:hypothetical protein
MLIKYALEDFSPVEVAFFQAAIGAVGLLAIVLGKALIIVGAEIRLRGVTAKRGGRKAKAHEYRPHPPFH